MNRRSFVERLQAGPMLLDGAMGTMLHHHGLALSGNFDMANRSNPDLVQEIHRGYIRAGADIIETNTFGANRYKLVQQGYEKEGPALIRKAVGLARQAIEASGRHVLLAGAVGPLGVPLAPLGRVSKAGARVAFMEQIQAFIGSPGQGNDQIAIDLLIFETMSDLEELALAVQTAREVDRDMPIIGMVAFTRDDRTLLGDTVENAAAFLQELDLDVIGINCSAGPAQVLRLLRAFRATVPDRLLAAMPNAGWPQQLDGGRLIYPATPSYFAEYALSFVKAGAALVGGCCGTNSEHIRAMRQALDGSADIHWQAATVHVHVGRKVKKTRAQRPTKLATMLQEGRFLATVEMSPPRSTTAHRLLAGARTLRDAGADFLNVADSPLARMRMGAWAAAHLVQAEVGTEAILHFPTRGRNLLRIQGDLLAAHALNIRNLFVIMGDPTHIGDYPEAMDNFDIVPTGLVRLIKGRLNRGVDQSGQEIGQPASFTVGCALSVEPVHRGREMDLHSKKVASGADFVISQPIFDPQKALDFIAWIRENDRGKTIPIIAGIQPLYSSGNAEFLHNEVPGINIPEIIRERMRFADNPRREGVRIAQELVEQVKPHVQGLYVIPVFGRFDLVADVLDVVKGRRT